jgi:hypothetical protein
MELVDAVVKSVGQSGQISLGKEYAGRQVLIETPTKGVWIIRTATIVPDEVWLHEDETKKKLKSALAWATGNPPKSSDPDRLPLKRTNGAKQDKSAARSKQSRVSKKLD